MTNSPLIYHIVPETEWNEAKQKGVYTPESIAAEGFIHCSLKHQVTGSANLFFKGQTNLLLLQIEVARLKAKLVYENTTGDTELFPHLYGSLHPEAVNNVYQLNTDEKGDFVLGF